MNDEASYGLIDGIGIRIPAELWESLNDDDFDELLEDLESKLQAFCNVRGLILEGF